MITPSQRLLNYLLKNANSCVMQYCVTNLLIKYCTTIYRHCTSYYLLGLSSVPISEVIKRRGQSEVNAESVATTAKATKKLCNRDDLWTLALEDITGKSKWAASNVV